MPAGGSRQIRKVQTMACIPEALLLGLLRWAVRHLCQLTAHPLGLHTGRCRSQGQNCLKKECDVAGRISWYAQKGAGLLTYYYRYTRVHVTFFFFWMEKKTMPEFDRSCNQERQERYENKMLTRYVVALTPQNNLDGILQYLAELQIRFPCSQVAYGKLGQVGWPTYVIQTRKKSR
ncbi:hypothetical protein PoMZ_07261 [Pyricularia oryzae]|uniref:Uncharacterized protein n=1 Tax=Pyricularia oryzae TaxID=318829 RepID=A0A4P7NEP9_PYROR|nr:hypothetical protein PoMZ_07261 [Pyricularia oryzae]